MKKIICSAVIALCSTFSQAQTITLDSFLTEQDYYKFELNFNNLIKDPEDRKNYLLKYVYSGHAIVYWLLANEYSKEVVRSPYLVENKTLLDFTKRMIYTALLVTEQDSNFCMDRELANAGRKLLAQYSAIMTFERKYFGNNLDIMKKSVDFLDSMKDRPNPVWVCLQYGNRMNVATYGKTYNINELDNLRRGASNKLIAGVSK